MCKLGDSVPFIPMPNAVMVGDPFLFGCTVTNPIIVSKHEPFTVAEISRAPQLGSAGHTVILGLECCARVRIDLFNWLGAERWQTAVVSRGV